MQDLSFLIQIWDTKNYKEKFTKICTILQRFPRNLKLSSIFRRWGLPQI